MADPMMPRPIMPTGSRLAAVGCELRDFDIELRRYQALELFVTARDDEELRARGRLVHAAACVIIRAEAGADRTTACQQRPPWVQATRIRLESPRCAPLRRR